MRYSGKTVILQKIFGAGYTADKQLKYIGFTVTAREGEIHVTPQLFYMGFTTVASP